MLEQATVGASEDKKPHSKGLLDWGIWLVPILESNACQIPKI